MKLKYLNSFVTAALLLVSGTASAHISYSGRDFGTVVPNAAPVTIANQTVTSNYGWADATDADNGDSHKVRYYRFNLAAPAYVTISFSGSTNGGARDGSIKPGFSIYQGLAHVAPLTTAPGSPDYDTSAISMAYRATLGYPVEGCYHALKDWRIGGENQTGPTFDFDAADGLSTFVFKGYAADGDSSLFGVIPGVTGDGNVDGTVTKSFLLPAGNYTITAGGVNYAGQFPVPDATSYGLTGTISASAFTYAAGDPADGGIGYQHQVTLGNNSTGSFTSHVGAWSWEDKSLFGGSGQGADPVGWTHTSNWVAMRLEKDTVLTVTMARDASVPWVAAPVELSGFADTSAMFPSLTLFRDWDNDGDDLDTYKNRGNIDWAEDLQYVDHVDNSTETSIVRTWYLPAGDYTFALGSNAPATNTNRQGFSIAFSTKSSGVADPVPNYYLSPDQGDGGGIGYDYTVIAGAGESGSFSRHVGAWSWEDDSLFAPGQPPVGWTHTSDWMALKLQEDVFFSLTMERDATVPWIDPANASGLADTSSLFPSFTLYRGWDNDGSDDHTFNNRGNILWAEDVRYLDHVDNSTADKVTRTWRLPAGEYSLALGSNAPANNLLRQGYKVTYSTQSAGRVMNGDPAAGGIGYSHVISVGRGDAGSLSNHAGAWSWEDNSLFNAAAGEPAVGWTHTSRWVAVHVKDHLTLNITMARDATVPWLDAGNASGLADTASMFPSFTLWRGWDNDGGDLHTYHNRGNISWAEDLTYIDHCDNRSAHSITRSYTLAPGFYTFALGSNAPATDTDRQGFSFAWTTSAPSLIPPTITLQPKGAEILATKSASFSVTVTGPNLGYQWFFKGDPLAGATNPALTITNAGINDAGAYTCVVRNAAGWVSSNPAALVVIARPVVEPFDIPNLIIGQPCQIQLSAANGPTIFAIKGLPKGLLFNPKTGLISGRPGETKALFTVEVTATNKAGASDKVTDTFAVNALAAGTHGSFVGPVGRSASLNALLGGVVKLQVTNLGGLSGTITLGNSVPFRVAAALDTSLSNPSASFSLTRSGQTTLTVTLVVDPASKAMRGEITDGTTLLPFVARQPLSAPGTYPGDYTFAMLLDQLDAGAVTVPQGHSVGAFKVSTTAAATGVLMLADNTKITFGGALEQYGNLTLFSVLYKGAGSVLGLLSIETGSGNLAASDVTWFKDMVAKDLVYADGFGPLQLDVVGRKYVTPAATALPLAAIAGAGNASIAFAEGGAPTPATRLNTDKLQIELTKVTVAAPKPGKVALSIDKGKTGLFTPGTSGSFKGSFELTDTDTSVTPNKPLLRKAEFQGMIVDDGTRLKGYGFFLLSKMPTASPRTTLATAPKLSGSVLLEKATVE
jgi:hypothetical protein